MGVMRHCQAVALALLAGPLAGCFPVAPQQSSSPYGPPTFASPGGRDAVQLEVAVLERPVGDRFINRDLWELADEEANLDRKVALESNGFRVCQIGGTPPARLLALLRSERSCANPRRLSLAAGKATPVVLGPVWPRCDFELHRGALAVPVELSQAQCQLQVVPAPEDGKVNLSFTPVVKHGETSMRPCAVAQADGSRRWELQTEQPCESYPWLNWELAVLPTEYVIVGTMLERPGTLGHRCFLETEGQSPVQRLLVLRAGRSATEAWGEELQGRAPPLALQAGSSARGTAP
jgi:hypothetical protein